MRRKNYDFISDPSHGWLKVQLDELEWLGITDQISSYSYIKGNMAYLEEDVDMALFLRAKRERNDFDPIIRTKHSDRSSRVRSYARFGGDRMVTRINAMTGEEFQERADTPYYASPSSETYWSA